MELIDKDALVAGLKKKIHDYWSNSENTMGIYPYALEEAIEYAKTLEVKEVDLENLREELDRVVKIYNPNGDFGWGTLYNIALHFFELGLKAQKGE